VGSQITFDDSKSDSLVTSMNLSPKRKIKHNTQTMCQKNLHKTAKTLAKQNTQCV
jgi:hypothetical protein